MFSGESETTTVEEKERRAEEKEVKERVKSGGRRRKKVKVKRRKKKITGEGQTRVQATKTGHVTGHISSPLLTNSNPYFKDLNFPSLPLSFDKSPDFSKFDAQFGGAVASSEQPSQKRLISRPQATGPTSTPTGTTSSSAGLRSRILLPKRRLFGSKAPELGLRVSQSPNIISATDLPSSPAQQLTLLKFPSAQPQIQHQSQLSFNVKEKPRTLLSRTKSRLRPSRVLFGHKSQLISNLESKRPQLQEPQFFTNVNIKFKPPQLQSSSPTPGIFQLPQSSGPIPATEDPTQFQLPKPQSRFQKSQFQFQSHLLRGFDGSYTINTDL